MPPRGSVIGWLEKVFWEVEFCEIWSASCIVTSSWGCNTGKGLDVGCEVSREEFSVSFFWLEDIISAGKYEENLANQSALDKDVPGIWGSPDKDAVVVVPVVIVVELVEKLLKEGTTDEAELDSFCVGSVALDFWWSERIFGLVAVASDKNKN